MNPCEENTTRFTPFWPLCLMALSLAVFLGWQVTIAAQQYIGLVRLADQQTFQAGQAMQAEKKLQAMMMDLLDLSKTDAEARSIVVKYGIKFNPAKPPVPPPETLLPQSKPTPKTDAVGDQDK
ncbi:MAG: hypothetical protein WC381_02275 [Kiritimatiellia bacterium]|jgi:hypothetical protein